MAKKYSAISRAEFHVKRLNNPHASKRQRSYSSNWLEGYNCEFAKNNYSAVSAELDYKRKHKSLSRDEAVMLNGYRNGCKARIDSGQKCE